MKRYYRDSDGTFKESASEAFLMHSTGKWDRSKTKYVKIVKSPSGRDAYLYPDDLEPGKKYGPKIGEAKADEKEESEDDRFKNSETGQYGEGNIDLFDRPVYRNDDGSISTVDSFSTNIDGVEVLLPTIGRDSNGKPIRLTEDEAVEKYLKDGKYLGKFKTPEEATAYAEKLHKDQEKLYPNDGEQPKAKTGKYAVVSGGQHYKFDNYDDVIKLLRGAAKRNTSNYNGITAQDVEAAKEQIKAGRLDEKGNVKATGGAESSKSKSKSKTKSAQVSKSSKSTTSTTNESKSSVGANRKQGTKPSKTTESKEETKNKTIELAENKIQNIASNIAGMTRSSVSSNAPRSREKRVTGEGTVAKGKALHTYKQVGSGKLDEMFKKMK